MRDAVAALAAAYTIDGQEKYAAKAVALLNVFFLDEATRMNPSLLYAQAIPGRFSGRGIGIIDTLHLAEVPPAIMALDHSQAMTPEILAGLKKWFADYAQWMTTHKYGLDEMNAKNNHSVAYMVQLAAFATLTGDTPKLDLCRQRYKEVFVPQQMAPDGSFPQELQTHQALRLLDLPARQHGDPLPTALDARATTSGRLRCPTAEASAKAVEYLYPFLPDKTKWPLQARRGALRRLARPPARPALRRPTPSTNRSTSTSGRRSTPTPPTRRSSATWRSPSPCSG